MYGKPHARFGTNGASLTSVARRNQPPLRGVHDWIAERLGFDESTLGWKDMLLASVGDETAAFERFFSELDAYRGSRKAI